MADPVREKVVAVVKAKVVAVEELMKAVGVTAAVYALLLQVTRAVAPWVAKRATVARATATATEAVVTEMATVVAVNKVMLVAVAWMMWRHPQRQRTPILPTWVRPQLRHSRKTARRVGARGGVKLLRFGTSYGLLRGQVMS